MDATALASPVEKYDVLIREVFTGRTSVADLNLPHPEAFALVARLNAGNLKPNFTAYEIPVSHEAAPNPGPDQAAANAPAAK